MIVDVVHIQISEIGVVIIPIGKGEYYELSRDINLIDADVSTWLYFSDGYVPNNSDRIADYLLSQKRQRREHITHIQNEMDRIDLSLTKLCTKGEL